MTSATDRLYADRTRVVRGRGTMAERWLAGVVGRLEGEVDLDRALGQLVDALATEFDADRATLYLVDHASRELVSRAAHLPEISEIRLRLGEGVAGWVGQSGEPVRIGEHDTNPRWNRRIDAATGYRTRSMLCVPVRDDERTLVGVLQLLNKRSGDFSDRDLTRLGDAAQNIAHLLDRTSLRGQLRADHDKPLAFRYNFIVGESAGMKLIYQRLERAAATDATVLIRGESGTGKELIARAIHFNGSRFQGPLVKVDCAALPETLIENELFGHERGAFTGADREADGKVAAANGGTLFLDEIGELPVTVQGKLLRLLQERTYLRVGGKEPRHASVRFVCATHRDLERMVAEGTFRGDLYWRLRVVEIGIPPLRERGHVDLDRLVDHFLFEYCRRYSRSLVMTPETRAVMHAYDWPGNVRELEHAIESAVVLAPGNAITPDLMPFRRAVRPPAVGAEDLPDGTFVSPPRTLREVELAYIRHALALCDGNRTAAARLLGIGRNTLARKLRELEG